MIADCAGGYGRGGGRGRDFDTGPAEPIGPVGQAPLGTAGRPGSEVTLPGNEEMEQTMATNISTITQSLRVPTLCPGMSYNTQSHPDVCVIKLKWGDRHL